MKRFPLPRAAACGLALLALAGVARAADAGFTLASDRAGLTRLQAGGQDLAFTQPAGFAVVDAKSKQPVALRDGRVTPTADGAQFAAEGDGVRLEATFTSWQGVVRVHGAIVNERADDAGFIVAYAVPNLGAEAVFSPGLGEDYPVADGRARERNDVPLAALADAHHGVALAIPPDAPRVFGLAGSPAGLAVKFYLGTSPATRQFPNRATFDFIISPAEPGWGFRSALQRYYALFPDYYTPRLPQEGYFMFQMADRTPPNVAEYGFDLVEMQKGPKVVDAALARDDANGISSFPYTIVGQREIKFLPALPADYDGAIDVLQHWTFAEPANHPATKENTVNLGDLHLKDEVENSGIKTSDGRLSLVLRHTVWGGNSITFRVNPNPYLFADEGRVTVGSLALQVARSWHFAHPSFDGTYVDSLGANWPAVLNYRRDHFAYAQYPLTVDSAGRVALQNTISHYEYIEALRRIMHSQGKLVLGNGVYAYKSRNNPAPKLEQQKLDGELTEYVSATAAAEHYRPGTKVGRFFCGALLDLASSEAGIEATIERCRDARTIMGPKPYAFLNYQWHDGDRVAEYINKSLAYGIYATVTKDFFHDVEYYGAADGYDRDRAITTWAIKLLRRLNHAGWQPVTHARVEAADAVACERFGRSGEVYLTLYNDSPTEQRPVVALETAALGFAPAGVAIEEIARHAEVERVDANHVRLRLAPHTTCILALTASRP